jgi:hypothetical protein
MTAKTSNGENEQRQEQKQRRRQPQIPSGDDNQRDNGNGNQRDNDNGNQRGSDNGNGEIQGSLHCAGNGEAVPRFGRDDVLYGVAMAAVEMTFLLSGVFPACEQCFG